MSSARDLTTAEFDVTVEKGVSLIDFWAEWCGPCRMMGPIIDQVADEFAGKVTVAKVNVDEEGELAMKYQVSSIPTFLVIKDGKVQKKFVGITNKNDLTAALDAATS